MPAMLSCRDCHRHFHADETSCPFCDTPVALTSAPNSIVTSVVAFAAGLSLLACTESGEESGESNASTTDLSSTTDMSSTMGDGDGDMQETTDYSGADYGGPPPPCDELNAAMPLNVGNNPVDTTNGSNGFVTSCGDASGTGPDQVFVFNAPADASFSFAMTTNVDAWLLQFGNYYCYTYGQCVMGESLDIVMAEGETLHLIMDGSAGGAASIDITQN